MKIVLASNNKHKVEEILHILGPGTELITPSQLGVMEDIPETGNTFVDNARQKAVYLQRFTELPVLADDSGLEVTALNHEPGVFSARYGGPQKNDEDNIRLLLKNLEGKPDRTARFRTVLVLLMDDREFVFEGIITGRISTEKHGTRGFGYDPVFVPDGHQKSFAEMSPEEKNAISHRALAVQELKNFLSLR